MTTSHDPIELGSLLFPKPPDERDFGDWTRALGQDPTITGIPGWFLEPHWGAVGWDLGNHPYTAVALYDTVPGSMFCFYGVVTWTEGDLGRPRGFTTREERDAYVDEVALFGWIYAGNGPDAALLPEEGRPDLLPLAMRGPYRPSAGVQDDPAEDAPVLREPETIHDADLKIRGLYRSIRIDIEDSDGWNGGDVVDLLTGWFSDMGFELDARTGDLPYDDAPSPAP